MDRERMEGRFKTTPRYGYIPLRIVSVDDDTDLTVENMKDGVPAGAVKCLLNHAIIIFKGSNAEDETFAFTLYGQRMDGPAERILTGTGALGDVKAPGTTMFYANSLTIVQKWLGTIYEVAVDNVDGYISKLGFDCCGYDKLYMICTKTNCASIGADVSFL